MARKKVPAVSRDDARTIGGLLRGLRRASGLRAVADAAASPGCPAARQTIYAYERGALTPSLAQFLELVEFYALKVKGADGPKHENDIRTQAVAAIAWALTLPAYKVVAAQDLMARLQPPLPRRSKDD